MSKPKTGLRIPLALLVALAATVMAVTVPASATSAPPGCDNRNNNTYTKLLDCVTLEGVRQHQAALQAIADANGGTRAAATPGYDASVDYVVETLEDAGWSVELHQFDFTVAEPILQLTPAPPVMVFGGAWCSSTNGSKYASCSEGSGCRTVSGPISCAGA